VSISISSLNNVLFVVCDTIFMVKYRY